MIHNLKLSIMYKVTSKLDNHTISEANETYYEYGHIKMFIGSCYALVVTTYEGTAVLMV